MDKIHDTFNRTTQNTTDHIVNAVAKRYRDAYRVARFVDGIGSFIKIIGVVVAGAIALASWVAAQNLRIQFDAAAVAIMIIAGLVFLIFYTLGVLISAQGQILKASLDGAVNSSPFLTNESRAQAMSLPKK